MCDDPGPGGRGHRPAHRSRARCRPITANEQTFFAYYKLDQARTKGYTGKGVTIALIDGEVDTTAPELAGATIIDKSPCTVTSSPFSKTHGTSMASLLVSKAYGVAPDATLLTYTTSQPGDNDVSGRDCTSSNGNGIEDPVSLINRAISDGAQIISISSSNDESSDTTKWAIAEPTHSASSSCRPWVTTRKTKHSTPIRSGLASWVSAPSTPPAR